MKAILILDEMPKQCCDCTFYKRADNCIYDVYACRITHSIIGSNGYNYRPNWCPLKELPKKLPITADIDYITGYNTGWNDCIEHIEED